MNLEISLKKTMFRCYNVNLDVNRVDNENFCDSFGNVHPTDDWQFNSRISVMQIAKNSFWVWVIAFSSFVVRIKNFV